jgi:hypothetical protein
MLFAEFATIMHGYRGIPLHWARTVATYRRLHPFKICVSGFLMFLDAVQGCASEGVTPSMPDHALRPSRCRSLVVVVFSMHSAPYPGIRSLLIQPRTILSTVISIYLSVGPGFTGGQSENLLPNQVLRSPNFILPEDPATIKSQPCSQSPE